MVIKDLIDISRTKEGGFVEYQWLKPTTGLLSPKISYAKSFEPWGWMVGTGVYLDEVEKLIQNQRETLKNRLNHYSLQMVLLLVILFIVGIIGIIITNHILNKEISLFNRYFEKAASSYERIDEENIRLSEFKKMVHYINTMISAIQQRKQKLNELNLTLESKVAQKTKDLSEQNPVGMETFNLYMDSLFEMLGERWVSPGAVNSRATDILFESKHRVQSALFGPEEGQAWQGWNQHFLQQIVQTADAHPDKRILVLVGAEHAYWLRAHLADSEITLLDTQRLLAGRKKGARSDF